MEHIRKFLEQANKLLSDHQENTSINTLSATDTSEYQDDINEISGVDNED